MRKVFFLMALLAVTNVAIAQNVLDVNLFSLLAERDNNIVRVEQQYNNRTIRTSGSIENIFNDGILLSADRLELLFMSMLFLSPNTTTIRVYFNQAARAGLASLNRYQSITVIGVYDSRNNVIRNASIETAEQRQRQAQQQEQRQAQQRAEQMQRAEEHLERGTTLLTQGNHDRAIAEFNEVIRLAPDLPAGYLGRGTAHFLKGDWDRAINDFTQGIQYGSNNLLLYGNRAMSYMQKGDWDRAIADYNELIRLSPNDTTAYTNRGVAYFRKGDFNRAIADYEAALRINPNDATARDNLEHARQQQRR